MKSEMTKNERSALVASYDVNGVHVDIDIDFVKSYLVRGNAENITDQELVFFLNTCKSQKLNPLVQGEENEIDALWASEMYAQLHYDEMLYSGKKVGERPDTMQV